MKPDDFVITCKHCESSNCKINTKNYPDMAGSVEIVCLDCGFHEFVQE